jgi:hypothetical protein
MTIIEELTQYLHTIETFDKDSAQDGTALHGYLIQLTNYMARANYLMAEYKRENRINKKNAYHKLAKGNHSKQPYFSPMLAKDYIDSVCDNSGYHYDLAERLSRSCVHTIDVVRTIVSSLKSERQFLNY